MLVHLDLFSGIGGFSLACEWNGIETICFVEIDKYCQKVLRKHWPNVPIVGDIRNVEKIKEIVAHANKGRHASIIGEALPKGKSKAEPNTQLASRSQSGDALCGDDSISGSGNAALLITAGFPCQPFSVAGKRGSYQDDRYLWPQTIAVIEEIKPKWVLLENVTGIINLALDTVLSDLEGAGYSYETLIIPACAVNAPHRRDRVWIVAYSRSLESRGLSNIKWQRNTEIGGSSQDVADSAEQGLQRQGIKHKLREVSTEAKTAGCSWWAVEPELGRVAHGIPCRVDRLKCLGNAIVAQVAYEIIKAIKTNDRD